MNSIGTKAIKVTVLMAAAVLMLTGCRFGFASDPDDPNEVVQEEPIDTSVDTFEYDASLSGTKITLLNSKAEIQVALTKMAEEYEKKSGVHVEVMPVTDGDSPYTKVVSMYNSGTPPTMAILDTTDVIALAEEKAVDLTGEPWTAEAEGYLTEVNGKIYSFPLCIEGRGLIYNRSVIEETLGREFDPLSVTTMDEFVALLDQLTEAGMKRPVSVAKEDWSLGAHQLGFIYDTYDGTGIRDYIHVTDLAIGHLKALNILDKPHCTAINLGTGKGYSVLDVINAFSKASGKNINYTKGPRRAGDIASCYAEPTKAKELLDWEAKYDLEKMCEDMWKFQQQNPTGYNK